MSRSAEAVLGEAWRLALTFLLAFISFYAVTLYPARALSAALGIAEVPFLGIALLGGFTLIFWISTAHTVAGESYGIITALLAAAFCLFASPWFGISEPAWYGVYGLTSYFLAGLLTEKLNGGLGNLACLSVNWLALGFHHNTWPPPTLAIVFLVTSFISGLAGDKLAKIVWGRIRTEKLER